MSGGEDKCLREDEIRSGRGVYREVSATSVATARRPSSVSLYEDW